ncbi:MAG: SCO family protein [Methylococcaceae bacterium]|nr:SCO family protein [Methylococcaceae bacterium]
MNYPNQALNLMGRRVSTSVIIFCAMFLLPLSLIAEELNNEAPEYSHSISNYNVPDVKVVRHDGKKVSLLKELDDGRPVILNFVFASCSAICPMLSHIFSKVQEKLTQNKQPFHLVSISIDPENDTPAKLIEYAKKFDAGSQWDFYTGTVESSIAIQKAFNAYRGDKMNHSSIIFLRAAKGKSWLRLDGFASPDAVVHEYATLK